MNRRTAVIAGSSLFAEFARLSPSQALANMQTTPLPSEVVRDFVRASHADLTIVRSTLATQPTLANACWDWGAGDFETAIGAASHMGRRDIAEVPIAAGARSDVFTTIVLRDFDFLRAQLARYPALVLTKGPHGLTFEMHAKATGDADVMKLVADIVAEARAALR